MPDDRDGPGMRPIMPQACNSTPKCSCSATQKLVLYWLQEKAQAAMKGLDLDELLSEPSASAAAQPQPSDTRQHDAGASEHAAQSPVAASVQSSREARPEGGPAQSSSSSRPGGGIGGNNDIVTRLKSRTERNRGGPA
jgi:hypothetical protein